MLVIHNIDIYKLDIEVTKPILFSLWSCRYCIHSKLQHQYCSPCEAWEMVGRFKTATHEGHHQFSLEKISHIHRYQRPLPILSPSLFWGSPKRIFCLYYCTVCGYKNNSDKILLVLHCSVSSSMRYYGFHLRMCGAYQGIFWLEFWSKIACHMQHTSSNITLTSRHM